MVELKRVENVVTLSGTITFDSVYALRLAGEKIIAPQQALTFSFSEIEFCDSSALALLLAWMRFAKKQSAVIQFEHLPDALKAMASLCDVEAILGIEN